MSKNVTIARLNTLVTANAAQFTRELDKASAVAKTRGVAINSALNAVGAGLSIGAVVAFGKSIIDLGGRITDLASQADLSARGLQAISVVAGDNGVSMEEVAKASEKMRSKLQDALANGSDPLNKGLRKLGLSAAGLSGLNTDEKWQAISRALVGAKNQQEAMNIASDIFGEKIGPKLRSTFESLTGGIDKAAAGMGGMILSNEQLARLDDFGDKLQRLGLFAKVFAVNIADGNVGFQGLWKGAKQLFTGPEKLSKLDIRNSGELILPGGSAKPQGDLIAEKMRAAQEAAWKKNDEDYRKTLARIDERKARKARQNASDPLYQLNLKKGRKDAAEKYAEAYLGGDPRFSGLLKDIQRGPVDASAMQSPTDAYSRIGLMTGQVAPAQKESNEHLRKIRELLEKIATAVRGGTAQTAAYAN